MDSARTCSRCVIDETLKGVRFDADGVCHLCHVHDRLRDDHAIGNDPARQAEFQRLIERIKAEGRGKEFDCIVPVSGGGDSSYTLYLARQHGLRPVAYTFDNGFTSDVARANLAALTSRLGVPLKTLAPPQPALRDAFVAMLKGSVTELCLPCLVGIWSIAYHAAYAEGVSYVLHGTSPMTEGLYPISWNYVDGRYLESVVKQHGSPGALAAVKSYNLVHVSHMIADAALRRTRVIMMPLYVDWRDANIKEVLTREVGWQDGGKHADCIYTPFRAWVIWRKFGHDLRRIGMSANVRNGQIARADALATLSQGPTVDDATIAAVLDRLGLSRDELEAIVARPPKTFHDYNSYYPMVRAMKPLVGLGVRLGLLSPMVYDKYFEC